MRKNKRILLIALTLVIICVIFFISRLIIKKNDKTQILAQIYQDLSSSQIYYFEWEQNDKNKTIMAKKDDKIIIDQYSKDSHTTTLVKDNTSYLILHDRKEYIIYGPNIIEQNILLDGLKQFEGKEFSKGKEKVKGKKYDYEEYIGSSMFMVNNALDIKEEDIKTRFYFDKKDKLVYIKTIYGEEQEILKVKLEKDVDDALFEIPSDYAEN